MKRGILGIISPFVTGLNICLKLQYGKIMNRHPFKSAKDSKGAEF